MMKFTKQSVAAFLFSLLVLQLPAELRAQNSCQGLLLSSKNLRQTLMLQDSQVDLSDFFTRVYTATENLNIPKSLDEVFPHLQAPARQYLIDTIESVDHVGFLLPATFSQKQLATSAKSNGKFELTTSFASSIVAKELGQKLGVDKIETTITILKGKSGNPGIEIFQPAASPSTVAKWIRSGTSAHLAFRVRRLQDLGEIQRLLTQDNYQLPAFMNQRPMVNLSQGTATLYLDVNDPRGPFRVEFIAPIGSPAGESVLGKLENELNEWILKAGRNPSLASPDADERRQAMTNCVLGGTTCIIQADFQTVPLVERFKGEETGKMLWSDRMQKEIFFKTEYFSKQKQEKHQVFLRNGLLVDGAGLLFDSSKGALNGLSNSTGRAMLVMDKVGNLYALNEQELGRLHHSTLVAGGPVAFAGEIEVHQGKISKIKNLSGHYRPPMNYYSQLLFVLVNAGVPLSSLEIEAVP